MQLLSLIFYNLSVRLYGLGIFVAAFFNVKARLWIEGRKKQERIKIPEAITGGKRIWVHCASLGEFEQARPVIEKIKSNTPASFIILTFFSPSGYEIRKNYPGADVVLYLPLDTANNAERFIDTIKPDIALFVKYEFWYHYLTGLRNRKIPTMLFSAIFRREQIFFKWYGGFFRDMLRSFDKIFVQNKESQQLLAGISVKAEVSFDTRFDRVSQVAQSAKSFPAIEKFKGGNKILIAGSTWSKDELLLTDLIFNRRDFKNWKYILAPHNLSEHSLKSLQSALEINTRIDPPVQTIRLSQLTADNALTSDVLIVDTMGDLSSLYRYGDIAYVGGAFNTGVHNVLEPAVYGLPVIFGPNYLKSAEAKELIDIKAAFSISGYNQLLTIVSKLNTDAAFMKEASDNSMKYVKARLGGVSDIYNYIMQYL